MFVFLKWYLLISRSLVFIFLMVVCCGMHKRKDKYQYKKYVLESIGVFIGTTITFETLFVGKALFLIGCFLEQASNDVTNFFSNTMSANAVEQSHKYDNFKKIIYHLERANVTKGREREELNKLLNTIGDEKAQASARKELEFTEASLKLNYDTIRKVMKDDRFTTEDLLYCAERYNQAISKNNPDKKE